MRSNAFAFDLSSDVLSMSCASEAKTASAWLRRADAVGERAWEVVFVTRKLTLNVAKVVLWLETSWAPSSNPRKPHVGWFWRFWSMRFASK